ncbi:MAG: AMP-binding protein [Actinomycetes bacterium]
MSRPVVRALDADPGALDEWVAAVRSALDGSGPPVLPLPVGGPAGVRGTLVDAFCPEDPAAPADVDGLAFVVPTSGSTGEPKGALLTAAAVRASAAATSRRLGGPGRWVLALALSHVAGLMVVARAVLAGHPPVLSGPAVPAGSAGQAAPAHGFDPASFGAATRAAATEAGRAGVRLYTSLVPTQLDRLLTAEVDLRAYDAVLLGGTAAAPALLDRAGAAGVSVVTTYGMSETCGGCLYDGSPLDGVEVALGDQDPTGLGRVLVAGSTLFSGYRLRPDLTAGAVDGAGRLRTSDLGRWQNGRLTVVGRIDDVIVTGGEKVVPGPVESVLSELVGPAPTGSVRAWCVVGVPDEQWGEQVVAVAAAAPDVDLGPVERLRELAADRLPAAWLPRSLVRVDKLPMLATGKVDRSGVRALAVAALSAGTAR